MSEIVYLYGFVPKGTAPPPALTGVGGGPVHLRSLDGFAAAVSTVGAGDYGPAVLEERLKDLGWVALQGADHERVVAWFVDHQGILPAPLFTLYSSERALQEQSALRSELIRRELDRLAGQREWDLKISYRATELAGKLGRHSERIAEIEQQIAHASPGRRYLLEKKRAEAVKQEVGSTARRLAGDLFDRVRERTSQSVALPLPAARDDLPVVLHAALLVHAEQERALVAQLEEAARNAGNDGLTVVFSGPWAPYRFVQHG